jgi:surface antigen
MVKKILSITVLVTFMAGCMPNHSPKQTIGQLGGGVLGAIAGSHFGKGRGKLFGVAIGALAGSFLGGALGRQMDERDRQLAQNTMQDTLERAPDRQVQGWRNPNNNHAGRFQVTRTQEIPSSHQVCRDYVHTVIIDGREEEVHGRACRNTYDAHGTWMVQN